eukprot:SAG31_NODE_43789_length_265_cov_1.024096_1_plen_22_part_10
MYARVHVHVHGFAPRSETFQGI